MVTIIQLKKYRWGLSFCYISIFLALALFYFPEQDLFADKIDRNMMQKLPSLHHIGIIPLQVEGSSTRFQGFKKKLDEIEGAFSHAIRGSKRFVVLHDELVRQLWSFHSGRKELQDDYELSAFTHLHIKPSSDHVVLTVRFLSPMLDLYLQESEIVKRKKLLLSTFSETSHWINDLVFRLINRLPIDISVTSVQGPYITLSGGLEQGLHEGKRIGLYRVWVQDVHPVLRTWRHFYSQPLGEARIIEVRDGVAVAKLKNLVVEDSIEIGDGAKSMDIASRTYFARSDQQRKYADSQGKSLVIPPLSQQEEKSTGEDGTVGSKQGEIPLPPGFATPEEWLASEQLKDEGTADPAPEDRMNRFNYYLNKFADDLSFYVGQSGWSYSGPGSTGSRFNYYHALNAAGLRVTREIFPNVKYGLGGGVGIGKTQESVGSFTGFDGHARIFWEDEQIMLNGFAHKWRVGGHASFTTFGVNNEFFGGYDLLRGGIFASLLGQFVFEEGAQPFDWIGELNITPLTFGRIGYGNNRRLVKSSMGWKLVWGVYQHLGTEELEWGGGWSYGADHILDDSSEESSISQYSLYILSRWRF